MHIVITVDSTTIVSSISSFHLELIPMFFHTNSIRNLEVLSKIGIMFVFDALPSSLWTHLRVQVCGNAEGVGT
jgi:hypothetical protein